MSGTLPLPAWHRVLMPLPTEPAALTPCAPPVPLHTLVTFPVRDVPPSRVRASSSMRRMPSHWPMRRAIGRRTEKGVGPLSGGPLRMHRLQEFQIIDIGFGGWFAEVGRNAG